MLLFVAAGIVADQLPVRPETVRFAQDGTSAQSSATEAAEAPTSTRPAQDRYCQRGYALGEPIDDGDDSDVTGWPSQTQVEPVAVGGGFLLIGAGPPSTTAWFSDDGQRWTRRPAEGFAVDLIYDIGTTTVGEAIVLDVDGFLSVSDDAGATWTCVAMPSALDQLTYVGGSSRWWMVAKSSKSRLRLFAVSRDDPSDYREVSGDFELGALRRSGSRGVMIASGAEGTVIVADAEPQAVVWYVDDGLSPTRVDGAFGDRLVTRLSATADGFVATVSEGLDATPQMWRSTDGVTWSRVESGVPVPTCSTLVQAGNSVIASGGPCNELGIWEAWMRHDDDPWTRIAREVDGRRASD